MKRAAIITLNKNREIPNLGNRLQNYAVQEVLSIYNLSPETILYSSRMPRGFAAIPWIARKFQRSSAPLKELRSRFIKPQGKSGVDAMIITAWDEKFETFNSNYIKFGPNIIHEGASNSDVLERYDVFVVGSDQVWNPYYGLSWVTFLPFVPRIKCVSYAASFGVDSIPNRLIGLYRKGLSGFQHISVREEKGAKLVEELTGNTNIPVLLDPTMMLSAKQWTKIMKPAAFKPDKNYALIYFLGEITKESEQKIDNFLLASGLTGLNISNIGRDSQNIFGPSEFVDLVKSATLVITDSFHGVVFSILFERPFISFRRESSDPSMYSRIETLLQKFNFTDRKAENLQNTQNILDIDFTHVQMILKREREKASDYLRDALDSQRIY